MEAIDDFNPKAIHLSHTETRLAIRNSFRDFKVLRRCFECLPLITGFRQNFEFLVDPIDSYI